MVDFAPRSRISPESSIAFDQPKVWVAVWVYFFVLVSEISLLKVKVSLLPERLFV